MGGTHIYVGEAIHNEKYVHVMAYQNWAESDKPNAMILPIPTKQAVTRDNVLDTRTFKGFLKDISNASKHVVKSFRRNEGPASAGSRGLADVFDVGSYTVILAEHAKQVPEALTRVPESKRPVISYKFLLWFAQHFKDQPLAICCWSGSLTDIEPLLWWYEPSNPNQFYIPTFDAHDGNPPDMTKKVDTDHTISVGSTLHPTGHQVRYENQPKFGPAMHLLPSKVHGYRPARVEPNADTYAKVADVRRLERGVTIERMLVGKAAEAMFANLPKSQLPQDGRAVVSISKMDGWY